MTDSDNSKVGRIVRVSAPYRSRYHGRTGRVIGYSAVSGTVTVLLFGLRCGFAFAPSELIAMSR